MSLINWKPIQKILADRMTLGIKLLFLFIVIYLVSTGTGNPRLKLPIMCVTFFLLIFYVKNIHQSLLWYLFLVILLVDLIIGYFVRANHHFLLIYITLLVIQFLKNGRTENFYVNIKLLVVIVLLFSAIQKLFSPQFISGEFYYYMFNTGNFLKQILKHNPEMTQIVLHNNAMILELGTKNPNDMQVITLQNMTPNIAFISRVFAWFTIIFEFIAAIFILWKSRNMVSHILLLLLIIGILITRLESGFLCLLTISGIWLSQNIKVRMAYVALSILFFALIIANIGFH